MARTAKRLSQSQPTTLAACLQHMRQQFPRIRPLEEEDDVNWWNEGLEALQANRLSRAEQTFKKLTLAQPEHFDGYYGLALVYQRVGRLDRARLFAEEAVRLGQAFITDGSLDPDVLAEMQTFRLQLDADAPSGPAS